MHQNAFASGPSDPLAEFKGEGRDGKGKQREREGRGRRRGDGGEGKEGEGRKGRGRREGRGVSPQLENQSSPMYSVIVCHESYVN